MYAKQHAKNAMIHQRTPNQGLPTQKDIGDTVADPAVYRAQRNVTSLIKAPRKIRQTLNEQHANRQVSGSVSSKKYWELASGAALPANADEAQAANVVDQMALQLGEFDPRGDGPHGTDLVHKGPGQAKHWRRGNEYGNTLHNAMQFEEKRKEQMAAKYAQAPSGKEYFAMMKGLALEQRNDDRIDALHKELVEQHGVYPSSRMDAYMLDDDSFFPDWVQHLPWSIRDQVKYGKMGLTEEDEALRVRLGRMPLDKRRREWERLKAAKKYEAAQESVLSPTELRDARQGSRRYHWLQRKRQRRATTLRRLAMRRPEHFETWPTDQTDFSRRLATIAQHVENGVATNGQWPLDHETLAKAKLKRRQEEAERTFLKTTEEKRMLRRKPMNGSIAETLDALERSTEEKAYKRLSRKAYANRVNAVVHGDQDEYGRNYHEMQRLVHRRQKAHESMSEIALERELRKEPAVYVKGKNHSTTEHWSRHTQEHSYSTGMPSMRYGS